MRSFLLYLLLFPLSLLSQEVKVVHPTEVGQNDYFELKYIVENDDVTDIQLPRLNDFTILSGPNLSTSSSIMMSGTKVKKSCTTTYTYILEPKTLGTFKIPSAILMIAGKQVTAKSVAIKVIEGNNTAQRASNRSQQTPIRNITEKDLFVKTIVSKTKVMEQEALLLTYRVYWKMGVGLSNIYLQKVPDFQGFVTNEIPITALNVGMESLNGETYKVADRLKYVLFPQQNGKLEITPLTVDCEIVESDPAMDAFDAFFNGRMRSRVIKCKSQKLSIDVTPLPQPQPDDFLGVVGELTMEGKWIEPTLQAGVAAHYQVAMKGSGNLKLMLAPSIIPNSDFDLYDVTTNEELELTEYGHKGKVVYDYTIVPKSAGKLTLTPITGSFYNTNTKQYEQISITPTEQNVLVPLNSTNTVQSTEDSQADIHTIHAGEHKTTAIDDYIFWGKLNYILLYILALCIAIVVFLTGKRFVQRDKKVKAQRLALKKALQQLKQCDSFIRNNQNNKFYASLSETILNYLIQRFNFKKAELSKQQIEECLTNQQIEGEVIRRLLKVIDECEFAKFAPAKDEGGLKDILNETTDVLKLVDK